MQIGRGFAQVHSRLESSLDLVASPRPASKLVPTSNYETREKTKLCVDAYLCL